MQQFRKTRTAIAFMGAMAMLSLAARPAHAQALPRDEANVYGKFENGVSYIIRNHKTPPDRVVLYLHVRTGALNETDQQNGLAHFLEHMAFNGSKHFPPGTLFPYLNKLGMSLGVHTNASTDLTETVYKLTMPDNKPETVDHALEVFSDYLYGLDLPQDQINRERFVILEEARTGKGPGKRLGEQFNKAIFPGSTIAVHDVIGKEEQITHFKHEDFEDYWNAWYRPENVTLIVVGDIDPKMVIEKAAVALGQFKARAEARKPVGLGIKPHEKSEAFVFTDPEEEGLSVSILGVLPGRPPSATEADVRRDYVEYMASWILSRRFDDIRAAGKAAYLGAGTGVEDEEHQVLMPTISVSSKPSDWRPAVTQAIVEVKRALDHGFTARELALVKTDLLSDVRRAVETEPTRNATQIVGSLTAAVGDREPIMSAGQRLALAEKIIPQITAEEVEAAFRKNYTDIKWQYAMSCPAGRTSATTGPASATTTPATLPADSFTPPAPAELFAVATAAWNTPTEAPTTEKSSVALLQAIPNPGKIVSVTTDEGLKITTAVFENGVIMHHRFSDYKKDSASITLLMPGGRLTEKPEQRGLGDAADLAISEPATSRLSSTQIRDLMTGKNVSVGGGMGIDTTTIQVAGSPKDLEAGMQLAYAVITDGLIEQPVFDEWVKATKLGIEQQRQLPTSAMMHAVEATIFANDPRLTRLTADEVGKLDRRAAEARFHEIVGSAPIEVAVSGDISLEEAERLVAGYVGSLPKRQGDFRQFDGLRKLAGTDRVLSSVTDFKTVTPQSLALAGFLGTEGKNVHDKRALSMIARILSDRMFKRIREKDKLVYSIQCSSNASDSVEGTGMIMAAAPTKDGDQLADTILEMMRDFAKNGPTDEEMATARKQLRNSLNTAVKEPAFWSGVMSSLTYRQRSLDEYRNYEAIYDSFSGTELVDVARTYMKPERQIRIVVHAVNPNAPASRPSSQPAEVKP